MGHLSSVAQMTQLVSPSRPEVVAQMAVAQMVCRPDDWRPLKLTSNVKHDLSCPAAINDPFPYISGLDTGQCGAVHPPVPVTFLYNRVFLGSGFMSAWSSISYISPLLLLFGRFLSPVAIIFIAIPVSIAIVCSDNVL